jgi:hypothetical protein
MKKTIFLSLAFLISFNVHGIFLNAGIDLANKCNKYFECKRAKSLAEFNGAEEALIYFAGDTKIPETQYEGIFTSNSPLICQRAVFGDEYENEKALACFEHNKLDEFHRSNENKDYYNDPGEAIKNALPNPDDAKEFYNTFEWEKLIRNHEFPNDYEIAKNRVMVYLGLTK